MFRRNDISEKKRELIELALTDPDSLLTVEIVMQLEEEYGIQISEAEMGETLEDLIDLILRKVPD